MELSRLSLLSNGIDTFPKPFLSNFSDLPSTPPTSLPQASISDAELIPQYQCLVGCLLYLAIATRRDISFYAMWLGQFNATPNSRTHFLIAKHILHYLAGTRDLALCLGSPSLVS